MRKAAARHLPEEVAEKPKLGFPVPTRVWLKDEHYYHVVKDMFTSTTAEKFFNTELLLNYLDEHFEEKEDNSRKIWTIYVFLVWYQIYFGAVAPEDLKPAEKPATAAAAPAETEEEAQEEEFEEAEGVEDGGTKVFTPVKESDAQAVEEEQAEEPAQAEEPEQEAPVYEDIYSSSPKKARRVNIEEEEQAPISFTDDIDPEDFFANLKSQLRENFDSEDTDSDRNE